MGTVRDVFEKIMSILDSGQNTSEINEAIYV